MNELIYIPVISVLGLIIIILFISIICYKREISRLKNLYNKIKRICDIACTDTVTGAYNRMAYDERVNELLRTANKDSSVYTIVLDIDRFKEINDNYGHHKGDEALKKTADALKKILDDDFEVFRIGGDEFSIIASGISEEKLKKKLSEIDKLKSTPGFGMVLSFGYSFADFEDENPIEAAFIRADKNMYKMKKAKNVLR